MADRAVCPTIATTGTWSSFASYRPFSRWIAPGPDVARTHPDPPAELGVADRLERRHLLVRAWTNSRTVVGPAPRGEQAVDAVAGIAEHDVDAPFAQSLSRWSPTVGSAMGASSRFDRGRWRGSGTKFSGETRWWRPGRRAQQDRPVSR